MDQNFQNQNPPKPQYEKFDKKVLLDTFSKETFKSLLNTERSKALIRGGVATIIAIIFFFAVMSIMLSGSKNTQPQSVTPQAVVTPTETVPTNDENSATVETKVGNPSITKTPSTNASPTLNPKSTGPIQKTQVYTINDNYKSVTFTATYEDLTLLVDFVVIDPSGNKYTVGDEEKYKGKLVTEWKSNSRLIKITDTLIEKGTWTVTLDASKNVPIEMKLQGTPL